MYNQKFYPTIVISDVHLGTEHSKTLQLTEFLKTVNCKTLILNGDIIDGWQLQKGGRNQWKKEHTDLFKVIMKMMEKLQTKVIYIRGNHDDFIDMIAPFSFSNIDIVKNYVHQSHGKRYYVVHGDIFDHITSNMAWLAKLGDIGYTLLLGLNRIYNIRRAKRGLPYFSLSQLIKHKVKSAVSYISNYEQGLVELARSKNVDGVICGHIHQPADKIIDGVHYLNSGDWVETMSALLEHEDGAWEVYMYSEQQTDSQLFGLIEIKNPSAKSSPFKVAFANNFFNPFF